ncbi:FRG domain-containing protein [Cupriavidus sp. KB_39]|uniref:FRG domain-containing protein n=1 Tax=Cupriavidus sp. KB_39 TaxID=3233036 RepID=UPI003F934E8F
MEIHQVTMLQQYIDLCLTWQDPVSHLFRGVSNASYDLLPSVGRANTEAHRQRPELNFVEARERYALERFQDQSVFYLKHRPADLLEFMVIAQHHGLPTRLLDWSFSPLVAMFFAVQAGDTDVDGAVYVIPPLSDMRDFGATVRNDPLSIRQDYLVAPPHINARVVAQKSVFTIHADPTTPLRGEEFKKVIFPGAQKVRFRKELFRLGIDASTVFPDIDGIAETIKFLQFGPNI